MAGNVITEIASECGVSEQAIRAWCRRNHVAKDAKGNYKITNKQKTAVLQHYSGNQRKQDAKAVAKADANDAQNVSFAKAKCENSESNENLETAVLQHYSWNQRKQDAKASCETSEMVLISMLQKELDRKNEQLSVKDKQIEELNARLAEISSALVLEQQTAQAAQALHAGTMQKQLNASSEQDADNHLESEPKNKKHWWHLW